MDFKKLLFEVKLGFYLPFYNLYYRIWNFINRNRDRLDFTKKTFPHTNFSHSVYDWQKREKQTNPKKEIQSGVINLDLAKKIHKECLINFKYVKDIDQFKINDYWATSGEVLKEQKDDCDGFAVLIWRKLRDAGFPDDKIGMIIVPGHMCACIYHSENDFIILDNGFLTFSFEKASVFFSTDRGKEKLPILGFNMFYKWGY